MSAAVVVAVVVGSAWALRAASRRARTERSRRRAGADLPAAASDLARSVRGGATLEVALRELAPTCGGTLGAEVSAAVGLLDRGHGMDRVLEVWGRASAVPGMDLVVAACRFSWRRGPVLERALDGAASTLLDRIEVDDEMRALVAQARTSAMVLVALPPVGAGLFAVLDPGFTDVLLATPAGRTCLVAGVLLDGAGAWVSRRTVRRAVVPAAVRRAAVGVSAVGVSAVGESA